MFSRALPFAFPHPDDADEEGYLISGGKLSTGLLETAYKLGIFPWPQQDIDGNSELAWYSPDPRAILPFSQFHLPKRVARRIRSQVYQVRANQNFHAVIEACAQPRRDDCGTWITNGVIRAYGELHELGKCHSVEVYRENKLVGGIYGVAFGSYFSAESMFHTETDTAKIALAYLVHWLRKSRFRLLDIQQPSELLTSLGGTTIPRKQFLSLLYRCTLEKVEFKPDLREGRCPLG